MYIDAKRIGDVVYVNERTNGIRRVRSYPAPYYFYVDDEDGSYKSMFGQQLSRVDCRSYSDFKDQIEFFRDQHIKTHESDVKPEYKLLEREYCDEKIEPPHVIFTDIETETDAKRGFADFANPYGAINAITNHLGWLGITKTYARIPPTVTMAEALEMVKDIPNVYLFETDDEKGVLDGFYSDIEDADIVTGWNSGFYDLPYIVQRTRVCYGKESHELIGGMDYFDPNEDSIMQLIKLSPFDYQLPTLRKIEAWGRERPTFNLTGMIHLDYYDLYKKFSMGELHSYKLDYVLQHEINEKKVAYTGTLDELWKNDFRKFIEYSIQDVNGLVNLDGKLKFIDLANSMAHEACVALKESLGSVAIIEQAILVLLHKQGKIAPDKAENAKGKPVAGAFVYEPIGGMYDWVTSFDINSLYPSVIRMLNISPETLIGQFDITETENELDRLVEEKFAEHRTEAWGNFTGVWEYHHIADDPGEKLLTMITTDGDRMTLSSQEWHDFFREENMCVTANGTVFDQTVQGIIPYALTLWYSERKVFQKKKKACAAAGDKAGEAYWDMRQYVMKIYLNSTYGALLNAFFRFYDQRFGQSVTLSGRVITKHMLKKANDLIVGGYEFGDAVIYGDTDSAYVSLKAIAEQMDATAESFVDDLVAIADDLGEQINESFPPKMAEVFFVSPEQGAIIASGREVVARRGMFKHKVKKRYALYVIDLEGYRCHKLKIMGMETQRSDTPVWIQEFLLACVKMVVQDGDDYKTLIEKVKEFRTTFFQQDEWSLGSPCRVSNLMSGSKKRIEFENREIPNPRLHYSVTAADNFNRYMKYYNDTYMSPITDGDKIEVICIKRDARLNPLRLDSIGVPVGVTLLSPWIKKLPVDVHAAYEKLVTNKLTNIFDALGWTFDIPVESGFVFDDDDD